MSDKDIAIKVESVSKHFILPHQKSSTLKSFFLNPFTKYEKEKQRALDDVSFEIKKGEFFGVVGRNGSGKSTLLKCIAGVYTPDKGKITGNGSLVPFIELGVGFNPELSGRDNIYLNGSLLGFSRQDMDKMYDDIVQFSELEKYIDQKLKNYSSGMQVRLAFSIAIQAKGDILILDEVLAVGDSSFQRKCYDYFDSVKRSKQTVVLVSHNMNAIEKYCNRAVLIENGHIKSIGSPHQVAHLYMQDGKDDYLRNVNDSKQKTRKSLVGRSLSVSLKDKDGKETARFRPGEEAILKIKWEDESIENIGVALLQQTGEHVFRTNTIVDEFRIRGKSVIYKVKLDIGKGNYIFKIGFFGKNEEDRIDFIDEGPLLIVDPKDQQTWDGVIELDRSWRNGA